MADRLTLQKYSIAKGIKDKEPYIVLDHIDIMCKYIELAMAGGLPDGKKNLIINIPPRFSKTHTICNWIEMCLGFLPDCEFIYASYSLKLAMKSVVSIRNTLQKEWFKQMFPYCRIDKETANRMDYFKTTAGGHVLASGMEGTITGFGAGKLRKGFAGAIIIDDPIKIIDAKSSTARQNAEEGYKGTLKSRRNSNDTPIIVIMQRTHKDDLAGYIAKEEKDDFFVLTLPAYDEKTKTSAWEERITARQLEILKAVDPYTYWSQYQQQPITPGGTIVKESWWKYYDSREEVLKRCSMIAIFVDTAMKKTKTADYSVLQVWGFEGTKNAFLLDQERGKWDFPELLTNAKMVWNRWQQDPSGHNASMMFIEDKVSGTSLEQTLNSQKIPTEGWLPKEYDAPEDKVGRLKETSFYVFGGMVHLPNPNVVPGTEWIEDDYIPEFNAFSEDMSHPHDDQVDPTTMAILTWKDMGAFVDIDNLDLTVTDQEAV